MLTQLPFTTSEEIASEFRPERPGSPQSALRTLKSHNAVSDGVSMPLRRQTGGRLGGKLTLYSSLNLDAARFAREGDYDQAEKIARAAAEIELAAQMQGLVQDIVKQFTAVHVSIGKNALISVVRDEKKTLTATKLLAKKTERKRGSLKIARTYTERLFGRVAELTPEIGLVKIDGLSENLAVRLDDLNNSGSAFVGAPLMITWERWPGGKTLMTTDAALDLATDDETEPGAEDARQVGYPYVVPLPSRDTPALVLNTVAGMRPTMRAARRIRIDG